MYLYNLKRDFQFSLNKFYSSVLLLISQFFDIFLLLLLPEPHTCVYLLLSRETKQNNQKNKHLKHNLFIYSPKLLSF